MTPSRPSVHLVAGAAPREGRPISPFPIHTRPPAWPWGGTFLEDDVSEPTLTVCSSERVKAWPAVLEDRDGCPYLVLMHPALVAPEPSHSILWCLAVLAAMAGAILG